MTVARDYYEIDDVIRYHDNRGRTLLGVVSDLRCIANLEPERRLLYYVWPTDPWGTTDMHARHVVRRFQIEGRYESADRMEDLIKLAAELARDWKSEEDLAAPRALESYEALNASLQDALDVLRSDEIEDPLTPEELDAEVG